MPQPLRKVRQRVPKSDERPPRVLLHLPFMGAAALLVVFAVAVGWAFFMGVMVGKGQNPAERVSAMLHEPPQAEEALPTLDVDTGSLLDQPLPLRAAAQDGAGRQADKPEPPSVNAAEASSSQGQGAPQAESRAGANAPDSPAAPPAADPAEQPAATPSDAYPFARPQGESLAAWGIAPGGTAEAPRQAGAAPQASPAPASAPAAAKPPQAREPKFDYVYQAAAFRGKEEGDALRARLEEKGLRTRMQKSGKVHLVLVLLRGSEREAENVRETLRRMGLGKPIRLSKKAVK